MKRRSFQPITGAPIQAALREIAEYHGYVAARGPHAGRGNPGELIQALNAGEVATVLLDPDDRAALIAWLRAVEEPRRLEGVLRSLAGQLQAAADREQDLNEE